MTESMKALRDLTIVIATFLGVQALLSLSELPFTGPITVLASLAVATWCLRRRGAGWPSLGLARRHSALRLALMIFATFVVAYLAAGVTTAIATKLLGLPAINYAHYGDLHGNLPRLALLLIIAWTSAGFGEEMLFRGFVLTRLETALGQTKVALILAVILQAILFGIAHYKQGPSGIILTGVIGLIMGTFYARFRNLWQLIIAHSLIDTASLVALYMGMK
jgi:membrane protease YdiL (CAAX protease family)